VMDLPNGTPKRDTSQETGEYSPTWSPDGLSLAFTTWDDREGHIMRAPAAGGAATRLTTMSAYYQQPAWSPDGKRILAIRGAARDLKESYNPFIGSGLGAEFVWIPAAGGAVTVIGPTGGRQKPHFTSDPDRFYTYGFVPANPDGMPSPPTGTALVSTRWDNTDLKQHLRVNWLLPIESPFYRIDETSDIVKPRDWSREPNIPQIPVGLVVMAPRGDHALAYNGGHLYVIPVVKTGAAAPVVTIAGGDSSQLPVRKLTDIGGEFPSWGADGKSVHWAIGNAFVSYSLDRANAVDDSLRAAGADSAALVRSAYKPTELRVRVTARGERVSSPCAAGR
jgi:dipeptidyl aminopeptidase/acylaminoacyl peptidase